MGERMKGEPRRVRGRFKLRTVAAVIKASGLAPSAIAFAVLFFSAVFAVHATEPGVVSLGDAVWLCFQVVTTIGLGDFTSTTMVGRLAIMLLSAYSVFFLAIVTGAVVSYCSEVMRRDWDEDVSELLDELDRLPEFSRGGAGRIFRSCEKGSFPSAPLASALAVSLFLAARFLSATCIETNWRSHDSVHQAGKRVDCA